MKITEFLREDLLLADLPHKDKSGALADLVQPLAEKYGLSPPKLLEVLLDRERLGSTGIGEGVAIPHGKLPGLSGLLASFGRSKEGVDFAAIDGRPTSLFFVLFAPENSAGIHLKALARISRIFKSPQFRQSIMDAPDAKAIYGLISQEDAKY